MLVMSRMGKFACQRWFNMSYLDKTILEIHQALLTGKVTPEQLFKEAINRAKNDTNNAFEYITEKEGFDLIKELDNKDKNHPLWGIPFVIKDNFSTKDIPTTASSNLLNDYRPVFSSEVYQSLVDVGAIPVGKTTLDEFAMGGMGKTGHKGKTYNPYDPTHKLIVGGSSCGSAAATASNVAPIGIGSDTGDSVRKPASYAGLVGFKPSWGRISRYGLFPFASSLDHVAYFTRSVEDSAIVLSVLAGRDDKDSTSANKPVGDYQKQLKPSISGAKIAVIKEIYNAIKDKNIKKAFDDNLEKIIEKGAVVNYVSLDIRLCKAIYPTYFIIANAESTSNNANIDGIKFGSRLDGKTYQEMMIKTRTKGFSELIKRRFLLGSYVLLSDNQKDMFLRAQKCRRLIVNAINDILKDNDVIYLPASPTVAIPFDNNSNMGDERNFAEDYLAIGNFAGLPSLTLPLGKIGNLPFGANITGRAYEEQKVFDIALAIENITGLKNMSAVEEK